VKLVGVAAQHLGPREEQHDFVHIEAGLHVVADGNGVLGDCSEKAVELFRRHLHEARALDVPIANAIEKAIRCADDDLCTFLKGEVAAVLESWKPNGRAMEAVEMLGEDFFRNELSSGSTFVALVEDSHIVWVGDSRAYRVAPKTSTVTLLTTDHVWTDGPDTVDVDGTIYKHGLAIARVLGHPSLKERDVTAEPEIVPFTLGDDEFLLLCSDGLRPFLEKHNGEARLCSLLTSSSPTEVVKEVIEIAGRHPTDNISLILISR
jgi:serine/threonine protein phosphatase PrpC